MSISTFDPLPEIDFLKDEIDTAIQKVLGHGQFILGPEVKEFEQQAADYLGVNHAVGVNSGTDALVIAMRALEIGPGDEVITTPFSFFATAESISMLGAKPVFVDIDEESFNIDPDKIEKAVSDKTKAILPVHLFGRPAAMERIMDIAEGHNLLVVEDCAQSFGAVFKGQQTGSIGHAGAFSFFPTKNLGGIGDGGLITTDDPNLAEEARKLRTHGSLKKYHNEMLGYNSRLDTIQAAVLGVKLKHINDFNEGRRRVAGRYEEALGDLEEVVTPGLPEGHVFHQYTIRVPEGRRDELKDFLDSKDIGSAVYYPIPQDRLPVYEGQYPSYPVSDKLAEEVLSLPIWPHMEEGVQDRVIEAVQEGIRD